MRRRVMEGTVLALLVAMACGSDDSAWSQPPDRQPPNRDSPLNVVLIIADDLGYGETGMMGNAEIPTPNIDALARAGVRCTAGYVTSSYCSPSRAGIMTGRYPARFGYDVNPTGEQNLDPKAGLPEDEPTFVKRLGDAGYTVGWFGKWHLGAAEGKRPLQRGVDEFFGFLHEGHYYVPGPPYAKVVTMIRDTAVERGSRVVEGNLIRGNYARMSEPAYDRDNPLLHGDAETTDFDYLTDAITEHAVDFIKASTDQPFCTVVAYNAVHSPMQAQLSDTQSLRRISDPQRRIFAGMLVSLDRGVGRIIDTLAEQQLTRRTLVVFLSDNGGPTEELTSSNAPLRGGKGTLYEGGVRVPMVWSLPGELPSGISEERPVLSLDIAATAMELARAEPVAEFDGASVLAWLGRPDRPSPHREVYWRMPGGKLAYRLENWKLVRHQPSEPMELYHLASDPAESRNLANDQPEVLKQVINAWRSRDAEMAKPRPLSPESERTKTTAAPRRPG